MTFEVLNDLPVAPGLEFLGPLGTMAAHQGATVLIPPPNARSFRGAITLVEDAPRLRELYEFLNAGFILESPGGGPQQRTFFTTRLNFFLGAPRAKTAIDPHGWQWVHWYPDVVCIFLNFSTVVAARHWGHLQGLIEDYPTYGPGLGPARYAYSSVDSLPEAGRLVGHFGRSSSFCGEDFKLHASDGGIVIRGLTEDFLRTELLACAGGHIATVPRQPNRETLANAQGEWQPGFCDSRRLSGMLENQGASAQLIHHVLSLEAELGGYRGPEGTELIAPSAAARELHRHRKVGPKHPILEAWLIGWAMIGPSRSMIYLDDEGKVWAVKDASSEAFASSLLIGVTAEGWFERHLFLRKHGYSSELTCQEVDTIPPEARLCEQYSDSVAHVYTDAAESTVWLSSGQGVQKMSRVARNADQVVHAVERYYAQ